MRNVSIQVKPNTRSLRLGAFLGVMIGIVAFAPIWMRNGGQYMEYGDYFIQYVPFIKELKRIAASGNLSWSWNSFLGDSFVGAYSYYTVFNPFAWFVAIFPDDSILYGTMIATLLKIVVSMIGTMLYIRRFCKKDYSALIGAMLYTFSGFTLVNTNFYFFLDVIAIYPFVMWGLERLICDGKRTTYVLFLMLNAAINFYFFISTVFLIAIYVIFRLELYKFSAWKYNWKTFCRILLYSIVGTGMASFALVPSFYAILGSAKATESIGTGIGLVYWPQKILENLRTLVAPIESGRYNAFYDSSIWSSTGIYLPVFGCVCVLQWCCRKNDWKKKVCIVLLICYFVPTFNAVFNLFSSTLYTRWLYGMALIFSLTTVMTLEEMEQHKQSIGRKILIGMVMFTAGLLLVPSIIYLLYYLGVSMINRFASACTTKIFMGYSAMVIMLILTAVNYVVLWFLNCTRKYTDRATVLIVAVVCALNFWVYNEINYDLHATDYPNTYYYEKSLIEGNENVENSFEYRIDYPGQIANYGLFKNMPAVNSYNSLQNYGSSKFAQAVGFIDDLKEIILLTPTVGGEYTDALLSVRYYYDYDGNSDVPNGFHYLKTENNVKIYENENYIPMGYIYDSYCLEEQVSDMLPVNRAKTMLQTMIIQKTDEKLVSEYLSLESDLTFVPDLHELATERKESSCDYFLGTSAKFA